MIQMISIVRHSNGTGKAKKDIMLLNITDNLNAMEAIQLLVGALANIYNKIVEEQFEAKDKKGTK